MPAEKFYYSGQVEDDGREPDLNIGWGTIWPSFEVEPYRVLQFKVPGVDTITVATQYDHSSIDRMIATLKRARRFLRNGDAQRVRVRVTADISEYDALARQADAAALAVRMGIAEHGLH